MTADSRAGSRRTTESERAQQYLDIAGVVFVALDSDGRITLINRRGLELLGYEEEELLAQNWFEMCLPEAMRGDVYGVFKQLMAGKIEPIEYYENPVLTREGEERIVAWHNTVLRDEAGGIVGTLSSGEDVTRRRQVEEQVRYQAELLESVSDAVISTDLGFNIVSWNRAAETLYGWRQDDVLGRAVQEVTRIEYPYDRREDVVAEFREKGFWQGEVIQRRKDGTAVSILASVTLIRDREGEPTGVVAVNRDITERRRIEDELRRRAALDRVRVSVYEMERPADIDNVLAAVYRELRNVGVVFDGCSINLVKEGTEPPEFAGYCISSEEVWLSAAAAADDERIEKIRCMGEPVYRRDLEREDEYGEKNHIDGVWKERIRSVLDVPLPGGTLAINSAEPDAFSARDILVLQQFAEVLSEAYTRLEDITERKQAEEALRRRASLDRVRAVMAGMRAHSDLLEVMAALYDALQEAGLTFNACSVMILTEENLYQAYGVTASGIEPLMAIPATEDTVANNPVYEAFREHRVVYRPDLDEEDRYDERTTIRSASGLPVRSVVDVPFSHGTIALNSLQRQAFSEADIEVLEQFAGVLSEAYTRFESIQRVEESEERHRMLAEEIRTEKEFSDAMLNAVVDTVLVYDPRTNRALRWNRAFRDISGYTDDEIPARNTPHDWYNEEDLTQATAIVEELIEEGRTAELSLIAKDGRRIPTEYTVSIIHDAEGEPRYLIAVGRDIAGRKRAEKEARRRAALDRVRVSVYEMKRAEDVQKVLISLHRALVDVGLVFDDCSVAVVDEDMERVESYYLSSKGGYRRDEFPLVGVLRKVWEEGWPICRRDIHHEDIYDERAGMNAPFQEQIRSVVDVPFSYGTIAINSSAPDAFSEEDIAELQQFAGVLSEAYTRFRDIRKVEGAIEVLREHSTRLEERVETRTKELKDAQEQLIRQERLAVLGQLAGGVGHELRNPLGSIKNAVYFLNMAVEGSDPAVQETLEILDREVETSERIISSLLDFARGKPPVRRQIHLNDVVEAALSQVAPPERVEVIRRMDGDLPVVLGDLDQLRQVFGNIVLNAIQAIPDRGQLTIVSEAIHGEDSSRHPAGVMVSFTDTGAGVAEEDLDRLFEPLFTTKARGIGLGLALSRMLVEGHGGTIGVESEVGRGSTFTVRIPVEGRAGDAETRGRG